LENQGLKTNKFDEKGNFSGKGPWVTPPRILPVPMETPKVEEHSSRGVREVSTKTIK